MSRENEEIRIEKYFTEMDTGIVYDIESMREEFEFELKKLQQHNDEYEEA
jgi:hypothetical protein